MTTRHNYIPLVQKITRCGAQACGPNSVMVIFTGPQGAIKNFDAVWVCSSGHCSDYDEIPNLRRPEDDPYAWLQQNARKLMNYVNVMKCDAHAPIGPQAVPPYMDWGQEGHLYNNADGVLTLCLPKSK